jgi:hypothetical protein
MSSSSNYSWFMQYMKSYNGESDITQLPLGMGCKWDTNEPTKLL